MSVQYGTAYTTSSGNSSLRVCTNYTITTDSSTGVKTVKYYYYLEVTKGDFEGTRGYVSWNPSATWYLNGIGTYQTSSTYTLTIQPGANTQSIPSASGGYYSTSSNRSTVNAISISSTPTYTVQYNANGGSGAPSNQTKISGVNLTLSSTVPTRTGYVFVGWGVSATATSASYQSGGTYTDNSSITLYAVWKINIFFDVNHDDIGQNLFITNGGNLGFNYDHSLPYDAGIAYSFESIPNNVVLNGTQTYSFALGTLKGLDINEGDIFYITLTYVSGEIKQQSGDAISSGGCFVLDFKDVNTRQWRDIYLPTADNPIYTGSITATSATASTADALTYWIWKNNGFVFTNYRFKVKIEKSTNNEYSPIVINNSSSNTYNYGNALPVPQSRLGYTFDAWYTQKTGGTAISLNSTVDISNGNVLYAHWTPNTYTLTLDANGGINVVDSLDLVYETNQNYDISQYVPTRKAYKFLGFYTADGVQVYDENGLCTNDGVYWSNNVDIYIGDYTLYAQWKPLNIAYYKSNSEWALCNTYVKSDGSWKPAIMYIKSDNNYIR